MVSSSLGCWELPRRSRSGRERTKWRSQSSFVFGEKVLNCLGKSLGEMRLESLWRRKKPRVLRRI